MKIITKIVLLISSFLFIACNEVEQKVEKKTRNVTFAISVKKVNLDTPSKVRFYLDGAATSEEQDFKQRYTLKNLSPEMHMLKIDADGFESTWLQIPPSEEDSEIQTAVILLEKTIPRIIKTEPKAEVFLNNQSKGSSPLILFGLPIKDHRIGLKFGPSYKDIQNIPLKISGPDHFDYTFENPKPESLKGVVVIMTKPAGVSIKLTNKKTGDTIEGTSDENGRLTLPNVIEGRYTIDASKELYYPQTSSFTAYSENRTPEQNIFLRIRKCDLTIKSDNILADIFINGEKQSGSPPLTIKKLMPGTYDIRVTAKGYLPASTTVSLKGGINRTVQLNLTKNVGTITLYTEPPGCEVKVNGSIKGKTEKDTAHVSKAFTIEDLTPGTYNIEISHPNYEPSEQRVTLKSQETMTLEPFKLKERWLPTHILKLKKNNEIRKVKVLSENDVEIVVEYWFGKRKSDQILTKSRVKVSEIESKVKIK